MEKRFLRILRILYQGFCLITGGLKKEIDDLEKESSKSDAQRSEDAKQEHGLTTYKQQS